MKEFFIGIKDNFIKLGADISKNAAYVATFLGIIVAIFVVAFLLEKLAQKKRGVKEKIFTTRKIAMIGMFSAIAAVIMLFEIPLGFAPPFYKLDFSELPILIGTFAFGPVAGVMMEFLKIVLKLLIKGTSTAFVGELANFTVGCSFIVTASVIYDFKRTKKNAIWACIGGTIVLTVFGTALNAIYLLPAFALLFHKSIEELLAMSPLVETNNIVIFVIVCVAPLNIIKGVANSVLTMFVYKPLSPIIKGTDKAKKKKQNV